MKMYFPTSHTLPFSTWGCSGAWLTQTLPSSQLTHKLSVNNETSMLSNHEETCRGLRSPKAFMCSHSALVLHFKHIFT